LIFEAELRKALHAIFSQFGKILEIVSARTYRLRGQAWVVFDDVNAAVSASNSLEGFVFYGKPLVSYLFITLDS